MQRKFFFIGGGVPPSDHQNLKSIHNIDQVCGIFQVFQGNFFFFCRKYLLGHQRKKINFGLSLLLGGGVRTHIVIGHQKGFDLTKYGELHPSLPALVVPGVGWVSWPVVRIDKLLTDKL